MSAQSSEIALTLVFGNLPSMASFTTTSSLKELLHANGVPDTVLPLLNASLFNIQSIKQFANFFESRAEIKTLFVDH